jgi:hypothetical protein
VRSHRSAARNRAKVQVGHLSASQSAFVLRNQFQSSRSGIYSTSSSVPDPHIFRPQQRFSVRAEGLGCRWRFAIF